jgi:hypothetical protein
MFKDLKTTITAIVGTVASIAAYFGFNAPPEVIGAIVTAMVFFIGLFAGDSKKPVA